MKRKELLLKIKKWIWKKLSDLAFKVWRYNYTQTILNNKVAKIRSNDATLIRHLMLWANCYEPINIFVSMCNDLGITECPIYLESFTHEYISIKIEVRNSKDPTNPYFIELGYSSNMERKLTWLKKNEELSIYNSPATKFTATFDDMETKIVFSATIDKLTVSIFRGNEKKPLATILIRGVKRQENSFLEMYEQIKKMIISKKEDILSGNIEISFFKIFYHIEYANIIYDGKKMKFVKDKLIFYKDSRLEICNTCNRSFQCELENGVTVELKDDKYNIFNISYLNKKESLTYINNAEKIVEQAIIENKV